MTDLNLTVWGGGERALLVHASVTAGPDTFDQQRPLADRWRLELVDRRGYGESPDRPDREDFEPDSEEIADLLGDGAHLVGHSYGGIVSLLAAARRPDAVRSLTVSEPPAFGIAGGHRPSRRWSPASSGSTPSPPRSNRLSFSRAS